MRTKVPYPSIDPYGLWETNSNIVADRVFSDFYTCDASQSYLVKEVPSMANIVARNKRDMENMCREIRFAIETIFSDYFNTVVANVTHSNADEKTSKAELTIRVMIVDMDNDEINLGRLFGIEGSKISIISNLIQG